MASSSASVPAPTRDTSLSGRYGLKRRSTSWNHAIAASSAESATNGGRTSMDTVVPMTCSTRSWRPSAVAIRSRRCRARPGATARTPRWCTWPRRSRRCPRSAPRSACSRSAGSVRLLICAERRSPSGSWSAVTSVISLPSRVTETWTGPQRVSTTGPSIVRVAVSSTVPALVPPAEPSVPLVPERVATTTSDGTWKLISRTSASAVSPRAIAPRFGIRVRSMLRWSLSARGSCMCLRSP